MQTHTNTDTQEAYLVFSGTRHSSVVVCVCWTHSDNELGNFPQQFEATFTRLTVRESDRIGWTLPWNVLEAIHIRTGTANERRSLHVMRIDWIGSAAAAACGPNVRNSNMTSRLLGTSLTECENLF